MNNYIDEIATRIGAECEMDMRSCEDAALLRAYAVLCLSVGEGVTLENVHDAWASVTSQFEMEHRSLVPFGRLTNRIQELDRTYADAIRSVAMTRPGDYAGVAR
jgi:hypothetical protein